MSGLLVENSSKSVVISCKDDLLVLLLIELVVTRFSGPFRAEPRNVSSFTSSSVKSNDWRRADGLKHVTSIKRAGVSNVSGEDESTKCSNGGARGVVNWGIRECVFMSISIV